MLLVDTSRRPPLGEHTGPRCQFYSQAALGDESWPTPGVTFVHVVTSARRPIQFRHNDWKVVLAAMPIKFVQMVVAQSYETGREYLIDSLAYQQSRLAGSRVQQAGLQPFR